jgi:DNA mismatch repair ATPase MutS
MDRHEEFLDFNGAKIFFVSVDGTYWIPFRPICEALNIDVIRCFKNLKNDPILSLHLSKQTIQVSKKGKKQLRNMTCIPEKYVYGWIFSLRSDSKELIEYKHTCYELLYNHFHGSITNRKNDLIEEKKIKDELSNKRKLLNEESQTIKEMAELENKLKQLRKKMKAEDEAIVNQISLFKDLN